MFTILHSTIDVPLVDLLKELVKHPMTYLFGI